MLIVIDLQLHPHIPHSTIHILAWVSLVISKEENVSPIYRVSGGVDTIFRGEKSEGRNFCKNHQKITDISAIYRFHTINRWYNGKNGQKKNENHRYFGRSTSYRAPATVYSQNSPSLVLLKGFEPDHQGKHALC